MLRIGTFARLSGVSVKALRYYDSISLLQPAHVDDGTGYRSYDAAQLAAARRITALKELGFTLEEIAAGTTGRVRKGARVARTARVLSNWPADRIRHTSSSRRRTRSRRW